MVQIVTLSHRADLRAYLCLSKEKLLQLEVRSSKLSALEAQVFVEGPREVCRPGGVRCRAASTALRPPRQRAPLLAPGCSLGLLAELPGRLPFTLNPKP